MSIALGHFFIGATTSLLIFRAIEYHSDKIKLNHYLRYDIIIASLGGIWGMIPDIPIFWGVYDELFEGILCNIFFFHSILDELDPHDSIIVPVILFGLFILTINLINLEIEIRRE